MTRSRKGASDRAHLSQGQAPQLEFKLVAKNAEKWGKCAGVTAIRLLGACLPADGMLQRVLIRLQEAPKAFTRLHKAPWDSIKLQIATYTDRRRTTSQGNAHGREGRAGVQRLLQFGPSGNRSPKRAYSNHGESQP